MYCGSLALKNRFRYYADSVKSDETGPTPLGIIRDRRLRGYRVSIQSGREKFGEKFPTLFS